MIDSWWNVVQHASPHSCRVLSSILSSSCCLCEVSYVLPVSALVSSAFSRVLPPPKKHAYRCSHTKLPLGVSVCGHGALWWTGVPFVVCVCLAPRIHFIYPGQGKAVAKEGWIFLASLIFPLCVYFPVGSPSPTTLISNLSNISGMKVDSTGRTYWITECTAVFISYHRLDMGL